ncbi:MAG: VCBS repeat-containing protein [Phycisphaerales bacterium]
MLADPPPPAPPAIVAPAASAASAPPASAAPAAPPLFTDATADLGMRPHSEGRLALADLNGDGRPDLVLARRLVFLNTPDASAPRGWRFVPAPTTLPDLGADAVTAVADFDNDGRIDAIVARNADDGARSPWLVLCPGRGEGTFGDPVAVAGAAPTHAAALAVGDVNGDGLLDFYRGNWYRKYGDALDAPPGDLFVQVSPATTPPTFRRVPLPEDGIPFDESRDAGGRPTYGAVIAHFAAPSAPLGPVQIAQMNYGRRWNRLYARTAGGWADVAPAVGFDGDEDRSGKYPAWLAERAKNDKRFEREDEKPFRANGNHFDLAVADVNDDGLFDCFVVAIAHAWAGPSSDRSRFLVAQRAETPLGVRFDSPPSWCVDRIPAGDGPESRSWNQGDLFAELADVDNDGRIDLVLASGDYPDAPPFDERLRIFRQRAQPGADGRLFEDITLASGIDLPGAAQLAVGDLDLDGDIDIVCGQSFTRFSKEMIEAAGGTPQLRIYLNESAQRGAPGTTLRLRGTPAAGVNADAIGAIVRAMVPAVGDEPARTRIAQLRGAGGHSGKQSAMQVHFGATPPGTRFELPPGVERVDAK